VGLTWSTDGTYNGGSDIIDYNVYFSTSSTGTFTLFSSNVTTKSATVTGLTPGTVYYFYVRARNIVGLSAVSSTLTKSAIQVPNSPTGLADVPSITTKS